MTVKEQVLALLDSHKGIFFSGEQLAEDLHVSRAAVWKAIKSLRNDGYRIDAVTNKGYCLSARTDILSPQGIQKYMDLQDLYLEVIQQTESTNTLLRTKANEGADEGYTLIANHQVSGRGRSGRSFFSPPDTGIYLSTLLKPSSWSPAQAAGITTMAAVAMCEAIEAVSDRKPLIKWVNDIYVGDKKVCGILTEGSFSMETGMLDYAVLGLGINVYAPLGGFPEDLNGIAGALFESSQDDMKNKLTAAFLSRFYHYYRQRNPKQIADKYRSYSLVIGRDILVLQNGQAKPAHADDIDDDCHLLVSFPDGTHKTLSYGEIHITLS